jgi:hypothetical protein
MNPAINDLQIVVRQVDLACPYPPMKVCEGEKVPTLVVRLARGTQQQENRGVEHVHHLTHKEKSRALVLIGPLAKIPLEIGEFVGVVGHQETPPRVRITSGWPVILIKSRETPTANNHSPIRVTLLYPGVLTPFLSISMAFPNLFNRVSSFLASPIQRQYSLRWV